MSKVVSLFAAFICALLLVNVYGEGEEYGIVSPDGSYKHNSVLAFGKVLKKLEDFTLPAGDAMLEKWIANLKIGNEHLNAGNLRGFGKTLQETKPVLRVLLASIPDKHVHAAIDGLIKVFEQNLEKALAGGGKLADVDTFVQYASKTMLDAMSKGTPTAETLA